MDALAATPDLSAGPPLPAPPEWLREEASILEPPPASELRHILRDEAGLLLDRLLVRVARGQGALDVALGEGLAALAAGDRALRLDYSGVGDYARERLGIAARTAQAMARLARELRARPLLREAVRSGEVSARKAQAVLPLAVAGDEAEWVARARTDTVRALEAAAKARRPARVPSPARPRSRTWTCSASTRTCGVSRACGPAGTSCSGTSPCSCSGRASGAT